MYEPGREKTYLQGFRPGPTQTWVYSHRRQLKGLNFGLLKVEGFCFQCKTGALISSGVLRSWSTLLFWHTQKADFLMTRLAYNCIFNVQLCFYKNCRLLSVIIY